MHDLNTRIFLDSREFKRLRDFHEELEAWQFWRTFYDREHTLEYLMNFPFVFTFFVKKRAILKMSRFVKWEEMNLEDFVIFPLGEGIINNTDFLFFSHFWRTPNHPDPEGVDLKYLQIDLDNDPAHYFWIDYCCVPQTSKNKVCTAYVEKSLFKIPYLIQNCAWDYRYIANDNRNRAWIFFETFIHHLCSISVPQITKKNLKYYRLMHEFLNSGRSVKDFLKIKGFTTASNGDLQYICKTLCILLKLRSITYSPHFVRFICEQVDTTLSCKNKIMHVFYEPCWNFDINFETETVILNNKYISINHEWINETIFSSNSRILFADLSDQFLPHSIIMSRFVIAYVKSKYIRISEAESELVELAVIKQFGKEGYREFHQMVPDYLCNLLIKSIKLSSKRKVTLVEYLYTR